MSLILTLALAYRGGIKYLVVLKAAPQDAAVSYLFHLMFPDSASPKMTASVVKSTLEKLQNNHLSLATLWGQAQSLSTSAAVAKFLRRLAKAASATSGIASALDALASVADQTMPASEILARCAAEAWPEQALTTAFLKQNIEQITTREQLDTALDALTPLNLPTIALLREFCLLYTSDAADE